MAHHNWGHYSESSSSSDDSDCGGYGSSQGSNNRQHYTKNSPIRNRYNQGKNYDGYSKEDERRRNNFRPPIFREVSPQRGGHNRRHNQGYSDDDEYEYKTSRNNNRHSKYKEEQDIKISASELVDILVTYPKMKETILNLFERERLRPSMVRKIANRNTFLFNLDGDVIELKPQISFCESHNDEGCRSRRECRKLHICKEYVMHNCRNRACLIGHKWDTNHNTSVLKDYKLNYLSFSTLEKLMIEMTLSSEPDEPLNVCMNYNKNGCRNRNCKQLHLCLNLIKNKACKNTNCSLNHDVLDDSCFKILTSYGIPVNDSPRDILYSIFKSIPSPMDSGVEELKSWPMQKNRSKFEVISNTTVWFDGPIGDVNIPEICYDSVESVCNNDSSGCNRLHSTQHFHWQISELGDKWYNMSLPHIKSLELSYCKPEVEKFSLERLKRENSIEVTKYLLPLMGRVDWQVDFNTKTLFNSSQAKTLKIRRLCTENKSGQTISGNQFSWYFKDKNQKWIEYGNVDSTGTENLVSSITSNDIENAFNSNLEIPLTFKNASYTYSLDFIKMVQTNKKTNVDREVRRRPKPHLSEEDDNQTSSKGRLPSTWEKMQPMQRVHIVELQPSSSEYQSVSSMFQGLYTITNIKRIQNPFHYNAFQNMVENMTAVYNDPIKTDVRQLFHGTSSSVIDNICSENFDPRLYGAVVGHIWGKGTYFSPDVSMAYHYCGKSDSPKYMFIARVAVGSMEIGAKDMVRPPINPATKMPHDSTVNDMSNPTIIVKYDKQEYYPEYLVTLN